jgi:peptidoglycan/LPS O-acetylase OafA/YrhL
MPSPTKEMFVEVTSGLETQLAPEVAERSRARHVPALDGLRTLAIASVMAFHARMPFAELGWLGVDLFFALSGFLITALLLDERRRTGEIDLPRFWARRVLRLMPAYLLYVLGLTLLMAFGVGWTREVDGWTPGAYLQSLWFYYCNYAPWGVWQHQPLAVHLWSLAAEEQFYLLWPIVMVLMPGGRAAAVVAWCVVGAVAARNLTLSPFPTYRLETRGLAILTGCAVALGAAAWPRLAAWTRRRGVAEEVALGTLALGVAAVAAMQLDLLRTNGVLRAVLPLFSLGFAILVGSIWEGSGGPLVRALEWKPLVHLGQISYGLYLYHLLALHLGGLMVSGLRPSHPRLAAPVEAIAYVAITLALAALSYRFIEARFLRLKSHLRPHRVGSGASWIARPGEWAGSSGGRAPSHDRR